MLSYSWWRHHMETISALLAFYTGNSPVTGEFPAQRPVTRSFDVFFDLRLNERLSKQSWGWWFETPSRPLWRHSYIIHLSKLHSSIYATNILQYTGSCFNIKISSYQYWKSHCGDKTILRPSYLHNGICYTGKTTSLHWIGAPGLRQDFLTNT